MGTTAESETHRILQSLFKQKHAHAKRTTIHYTSFTRSVSLNRPGTFTILRNNNGQ